MHWHLTARQSLKRALVKARHDGLKPPPQLDLVQWADTHRFLPRENSANPGRWKTSRVPVAIGPMRAVTEAGTTKISVMACTQLMKTEFLNNTALYHIHQDPASILFIQPTQKLAANFSKERFQPAVSGAPVIAALVPAPKARGSENTIEHKAFPGGAIDFVGANSPVDLASRPKRITLADEVDLYPADAGGMGDPLALGEERSSSFKSRRLNVRACSPSSEETSVIYREYLASDQRKCFVKCPHCETEQVLYWSRETIQWDKDENGNHLPHTARYYCTGCGTGWSEAERKKAIAAIAQESHAGWKQTKPFVCCGKTHRPLEWSDSENWDERGRSHCPDCGKQSPYDGHAGFQVSKLYSSRQSLPDVVREYLVSYNRPTLYRKFVNTALAEVVKEAKFSMSAEALEERVENYSAEALPAGVRLLVAGADTQDDRLEMTVIGYGNDEEQWVIEHIVLDGDTSRKRVWDDFDDALRRTYTTEDGRALRIRAAAIDSQGHRAAIVYAFCAKRKYRRIYATKGMSNRSGARQIWPKTPSRTKNSGQHLYIVGVDTAKDLISAQLKNKPDVDGAPSPNTIHFPAEGLSADYFSQLTAEHAIAKDVGGRKVRLWELKKEGARNEALDCMVYASAARHSLPNRLRSKSNIAKPAGRKPSGELVRHVRKPPKTGGHNRFRSRFK
ncbi:phage terminase large subunit family protein [Polycladidibacter hongkongensis]|uniref:phage terminase large subunit family protein n=1 Tax=Polycladidibacter hongkongensis TaxID=1647556 RepID=UPI0009E890CC|nr:terminase gpA endonuclease subunit [Pseudovibrio hongkongensis]